MIKTENFTTFYRVYVYDTHGIQVVRSRDYPISVPPMMAIAEMNRGVRTPPKTKKQKYFIPPPNPDYPTRSMPRYRGPLVHDDDCLCNKCVAKRNEEPQVIECDRKPTKKQMKLLVEHFRS